MLNASHLKLYSEAGAIIIPMSHKWKKSQGVVNVLRGTQVLSSAIRLWAQTLWLNPDPFFKFLIER